MYRACFEYNESESSYMFTNFIGKILGKRDDLSYKSNFTQNISISNSNLSGFKKIVIMLDILEDFTYELKSNFESYKDTLSGVSSYAGNIQGFFDKLNTISVLSGNQTTNAADFMKVQVWKETEPFKMNFKFSLQTKTDPFVDVYLPAILLCSQTILSPVVGNGTLTEGDDYLTKSVLLRTPGVNKNKLNTSKSNNRTYSSDRNASSKILDTFSILVRQIDGIEQKSEQIKTDTEYRSDESILSDYNSLISLDYAFIESAKPTWSKERTTSGIPLWCELELTVQSVFSANDSMLGYIYPETASDFSLRSAGVVAGAVGRSALSNVVNYFR